MKLKFSDLLYPRKTKHLSVGVQIFLVCILFIGYTIISYYSYQTTGTMFGYPFSTSILFVPIYEEIIFRGLILVGLTKFYSIRKAVLISSLLFGLWHFKNIFVLSSGELLSQIIYATIIFGPISALIAIKTKNIWFSVIFHYLNNIIAPYSFLILASLIK